MSEFQKAVKARNADIDRKAAENVRRGMAPWEAFNAAAQEADDDATEAATGHRPMRVIPMTIRR